MTHDLEPTAFLASPAIEPTPRFDGRDDRPHLVHVFPSFNIGGTQVRFAALAAALHARFRHTVVSLNGDYSAAVLVPPCAPVRYADPAPPTPASLSARLSLYRAELATLKPDVLVTYNWGAMEVAFVNAFGGGPHVHMEDGFGPEEAVRQFTRRIWARRVALARSHVVVPSRTLQTIAIDTWRLGRRNVQHIPNGIAPQADYVTPLNSLRPKLPRGLPVIAWVGALRPEKNPLRLLRAFAPLKTRAALLVIGDGPERDAVVREGARLRLGGRLFLLGRRTDTRDLIMQSQILALSSDTEQMPFAILEAMAAGLPVASTDVGDVRDMVAAENRPFVVPPSEVDLSDALRALIADPALRESIGQANRARQRDLYALSTMVEAYGALFDRLSARSRARRSR
ncbi:glycosyltransferase family 4 protein [Caulobacter sp. UNC279MFTsu5.1]|uniref:glycosyltransferase family 4 protein n=1 Tax=Caulobacter sp. UNC279MFTsu5.1 TaxID=1502775 RepID=UPI00036DD202|nr:glycosyltransferase family 4 protein [Caulobacter sp. UNC279MFTsu5.1]SFJ89634.1 Glycosyltransferase involved in cell wall bisynthesis [Caulobacter sp. UNC279MFTsu5.1]